eukprot:CAMPEP_0202901376 /NCGR_PEP_ID=MMETSP1392-20130828/14218_1 /ASSEMBLY_ACC=CAM_ASM_000868 /TAXON_ID=225041 /ORGANISM="Chlamydomonas chlamydogama, Strain SAG 11-48b" /LENGTH=330 /DNA_ID=CAMNT_0049587927 /DNA_START=48 /DNA_END=1040 /DNA_ORIENTATION=+
MGTLRLKNSFDHSARLRNKRYVSRASSVRVVARTAPDMSLFKLPLWASPNVLMPLGTGALHIYESRFLSMFDGLKRQQLQAPGTSMFFGHMVSPTPVGLEGRVQGWPKVGVLAKVTNLGVRDDGTLDVSYQGVRRFQILNMQEEEPYPVAYAMNFADTCAPAEQQAIDELEFKVYNNLLEVVRLSNKLASLQQDSSADLGSHLPESVTRYAPPPPSARTLAEVLIEAGHSAGHSIAMWQRHGCVYGSSSTRKSAALDPYQMVSDQLEKDVRQELFSFAAASIVDGMGPLERLALLNTQDTAARLHYVLQAVMPYVQELQAKVSMARALKN